MIAGDPFRKMIDCDAVNRRLAWILGPEFIVTGSYAIVSQYGAAGQRMHAGPWYNWGHHYRLPRSGRPPLRSPGLNLGWALRDVDTDRGDGGVHSLHNLYFIDAYILNAYVAYILRGAGNDHSWVSSHASTDPFATDAVVRPAAGQAHQFQGR